MSLLTTSALMIIGFITVGYVVSRLLRNFSQTFEAIQASRGCNEEGELKIG